MVAHRERKERQKIVIELEDVSVSEFVLRVRYEPPKGCSSSSPSAALAASEEILSFVERIAERKA